MSLIRFGRAPVKTFQEEYPELCEFERNGLRRQVLWGANLEGADFEGATPIILAAEHTHNNPTVTGLLTANEQRPFNRRHPRRTQAERAHDHPLSVPTDMFTHPAPRNGHLHQNNRDTVQFGPIPHRDTLNLPSNRERIAKKKRHDRSILHRLHKRIQSLVEWPVRFIQAHKRNRAEQD